jgi:uncharacterized protein YjcR
VFALSRQPSPKKYEALKIWLKSGRTKLPKEIAEEIGVGASLVRKWKSIDKWDEIPDRNGPGAPYRNKNAVGNRGGPGGPPGNDKAIKHGLFRKFLPDDEELLQIYDAIPEMSMLDLLYEEIRVAFTNFIYAQKIMFVRDQKDETKVLKKSKRQLEAEKVGKGEDQRIETFETYVEEEWEYQHAWDKQAKALTSQAAAMRIITNQIKQYEEMIRSLPPDDVKEEHRLRIEKLKADIKVANAKAW